MVLIDLASRESRVGLWLMDVRVSCSTSLDNLGLIFGIVLLSDRLVFNTISCIFWLSSMARIFRSCKISCRLEDLSNGRIKLTMDATLFARLSTSSPWSQRSLVSDWLESIAHSRALYLQQKSSLSKTSRLLDSFNSMWKTSILSLETWVNLNRRSTSFETLCISATPIFGTVAEWNDVC